MNSATAFGRVTGSAERPNEEKAEAVAGEGERKGDNGNACISSSASAAGSPRAATHPGPVMLARRATASASSHVQLALVQEATCRGSPLPRPVPGRWDSLSRGGHASHCTFRASLRAVRWHAGNVHAEPIHGPEAHVIVGPAAKGDRAAVARVELAQDLVEGRCTDRDISCIAPNGQ